MLFNPAELSELAQEYELSDPIDWGMLHIREEDAYDMIATQVAEILNNSEDPARVAAIAMTKLLVENFVLNLQLAGFEEPDYS